ncbi:MAG: DHA2 family efflux MFS transporter permease subunit [Candidatus Saccharicenans sp.]|nr:MAG: drug:proton antiporter [Candidatus Aminicenantes bacterium]HEK84842.1 DHA2 family efflux MFS transporter permease subunit [Candidatus Aminicenantes bacterium]
MKKVRRSVRSQAVSIMPSLHYEHPSYRFWVLANIMIGTFMAVMDATIVNVGLPKIMGVFGVTLDRVEWVVTAYMLVFAVMLTTSGWVADHFGYKRTYFLALFLFTAGSFLCSTAWSLDSLIFFRVIQGMGAGFMMPVGMAIVTREFPLEQRGMALGFWGIAAAASVSLGPMIGGYLIDNFAWHTIFDINVPVGIVGLMATYIIQREFKESKSRSFDFIGFASMATFLVFLLLALSNGNASWNTGGWTSRYILTCFALSAIGLVVFLIAEFTVKHPLIDLSLFRNFNFSLSNLILFIFGLGMFGSTFLMPLYLQNSLGYTAFQAGLLFLPMGLIQGLMAPVAGILSDRINPKIPAAVGIFLMTLSFYLNHLLSLFSEEHQIMAALIVRGFGMGLLFTPISTMALAQIPPRKMAQASGMFNVIRQIGGSFGVAMFGTLMTERVIFHTTNFGAAVDSYSPVFKNISLKLQHFAQQALGGGLSEATSRAKYLLLSHISNQAVVTAITDDFLIAAGITISCLLFLLLLKSPKRKGKKMAVSID